MIGSHAAGGRETATWPLFGFALLGAAAAFLAPLNGDTAWLINVCERLLRGEVYGVDVYEVNPPASAWLYLPAVAAAQAMGAASETGVRLGTLVVAAASIALTTAVLRGDEEARAHWRRPVALGAGVAFFLLPLGNFAQREHLALMFLTPMTFALLMRARRAATPWPLLALAGLGGGLALCVKPHFVLVLAGPALAAMVLTRDWRALFGLEAWCAAGVVAAYPAAAALFAPGWFSEVLPQVVGVYAGRRRMRWALYAVLWLAPLALYVSLLRRPDAFRTPAGFVGLAAAGFLAAFFIQGKNWPYHAYPVSACLLVGFLSVALDRREARIGPALAGAAAAGVAVALLSLPPARDIRQVAEALRGLGGPLRVLAVVDDHGRVAPAVRAAGGTIEGRHLNMWAYSYPESGGDAAAGARARAWAERTVKEDVLRLAPPVLVVQRAGPDYLALLRSDPAVAAALAAYRPVARFAHQRPIEVWAREEVLRRTPGEVAAAGRGADSL